MSREELRLTNLVTTDAVAEVLPKLEVANAPVAELAPKPVQDRFAGDAGDAASSPQAAKSTKTAEAVVPTGGIVATPAK